MKRKLTGIELFAAAVSLIGSIALVALLAENSRAAGPVGASPQGFQPGGNSFSNPFAAQPSGAQGQAKPVFDDDEEDDGFDVPAAGQGNPPARAGGVGTFSPSVSSVSVGGGGSANGVISHNKVATLHVDSETAEGSKEIVTEFNYPDADIMDIAKGLGKLTGKNFILDKDVKGRITIIANGQVTVGDAWKAFLTALDINGFALIPSGKFIRIARQRDARDKQLKTYVGSYSPDTDALITRIFPLKYLNAEEVARNFRSFMPANSRIIPYEQTNTVIVTDTGSNIAKLSKLLEILDIEGYDAGIEVIPVKYASAVELSKLIEQLIPGTGSVGNPNSNRFAGGGGVRAPRRTKEGGIINTIIADERTNTLIVHANTKGAGQVRELVTKLDQRLPATAGGGKVHVIYLQFADSEKLATTLSNISQQNSPNTRPMGGITGGTGSNPIQGSLFEGSIRVSADVSTNSLVVTATPADFVTVQRVVNRLDVPRDQVYAEIVIMELSLGRDFTFSSGVVNPTNGIALLPNQEDIINSVANPIGLKGLTLGFKAGTQHTFTINGSPIQVSGIQGLIHALQSNQNANILATPQILALDNTEATFETTEKIPTPNSSVAANGTISNSVGTTPVSLSIKIKPQINKVANFVKLDIETKMADIENKALPKQVQDLAFATIERNAKTSIVVADEDTAVLGGLVKHTDQEQITKIPILGDIPLLGWLFKSKNSSILKTNMLIFITPHIVRQYEKIRALLDKKLQERDDFVEETTGGEDKFRKYRDKMIRSLPDVKQLSASQPMRSTTIDSAGEELETTTPGSSNPGSSNPMGTNPGVVGPTAPADQLAPPPIEGSPGGVY